MWKKDDDTPPTAGTPEADSRQADIPRPPSTPERATIGPSIRITGEVSGDEDLLIEGQIDGSVDLDEHSVTVGREGRVKANINGRVVRVEGTVEGDLKGRDQVVLHSSASVKGDITSPRVVLEDGASFRGLVDMGDPSAGKSTASEKSTTSGATSSAGSGGSATGSRSGGKEPSESTGSGKKESSASDTGSNEEKAKATSKSLT